MPFTLNLKTLFLILALLCFLFGWLRLQLSNSPTPRPQFDWLCGGLLFTLLWLAS